MSSIRLLTACVWQQLSLLPTHLCLWAQKKSFNFPEIPQKVSSAAAASRMWKDDTPPCLLSFPLPHSEKVRSHLYLQGSCFFFKQQHDQYSGIWKTHFMTGENKSVRKSKTFCSQRKDVDTDSKAGGPQALLKALSQVTVTCSNYFCLSRCKRFPTEHVLVPTQHSSNKPWQ